MKFDFIIDGNPTPQPRARFARRGGFVKTYDPAAKDKEVVRTMIGFLKPTILKPPLHLRMRAYMPIPKSISNKKKELLDGSLHWKKPDVDNIYKFYTDAMEGLLYENDSHIASTDAMKLYSKRPRVEILLEEIEDIT